MMDDLHTYVWWLRRRDAINAVLRLAGLRLWLMAKFSFDDRAAWRGDQTHLTKWWPEVHRLSWRPEPPKSMDDDNG